MKRPSKPSGAAFRKRRKEEEEKKAQSRDALRKYFQKQGPEEGAAEGPSLVTSSPLAEESTRSQAASSSTESETQLEQPDPEEGTSRAFTVAVQQPEDTPSTATDIVCQSAQAPPIDPADWPSLSDTVRTELVLQAPYQFRTYSVKAGRDGKPLPFILCDTMGLEESEGAGLDIDDISSILKGHVPDCYQFNSSAPLHSETHGYRKSPELKDKIHCVAYVIDSCKVSIMPPKLEAKLNAIRRKANLIGIPQLVLFTKVDEACPSVKEDLTNVYKSGYIKDLMQEASARLGLPVSCVLPVKNYCEEVDLELSVDVLLLSAVLQMLRFADNYFDDLSDRHSNAELGL